MHSLSFMVVYRWYIDGTGKGVETCNTMAHLQIKRKNIISAAVKRKAILLQHMCQKIAFIAFPKVYIIVPLKKVSSNVGINEETKNTVKK